MVRKGQRILEGVDVEITKIEQLAGATKLEDEYADLFVKDISVGTEAVQLDMDPLKASASVAIRKTALNLIYVRAASGTQTVHVICGGA